MFFQSESVFLDYCEFEIKRINSRLVTASKKFLFILWLFNPKFLFFAPPQVSKCMTKTDLHATIIELHYLTVLETLSVTFRLVPKIRDRRR